MTEKQWTVKDLVEALKQFPQDAKVYYEMGPNGPGTIGKAQYVKAWGDGDETGVLLDRQNRTDPPSQKLFISLPNEAQET